MFHHRAEAVLGVQVSWNHTCCRPITMPLYCLAPAETLVVSYIDACIYQTSVSSLVDFRKPPCGTAPSVIPIQRGNIANFCRCAFLTLFLSFLSPCFSFLLTGADMSSFLLGLRVRKCNQGSQKTDRIWFENSSITDELAMSAEVTNFDLETRNFTNRPRRRFLQSCVVTKLLGLLGTPLVLFQ